MFNLLPESEKERILQEYNHRRLIVFLVFVVATLCMALVALFPSYVLSSVKLSDVEVDIATVQQSREFQKADKLQATLVESNEKLSVLQYGHTSVSVQDLFMRINESRNKSIRLNGLMYTKAESVDAHPSISVSGVAQNRESLSQFVTVLQKVKHFKEVTLPVSSFTKDVNADFEIEIQIDL